MAQSSGEVAATQDAVTDLVTDWSAEKRSIQGPLGQGHDVDLPFE